MATDFDKEEDARNAIEQLFRTRYYRIAEYISRKHCNPAKMCDEKKVKKCVNRLLVLLCMHKPGRNKPPLEFQHLDHLPTLLLLLLISAAANVSVTTALPSVKATAEWEMSLEADQAEELFNDARNYFLWFIDHHPFDSKSTEIDAATQTAAVLAVSGFNCRYGVLGLPSLAYAKNDGTPSTRTQGQQSKKRKRQPKKKKASSSDEEEEEEDEESEDSTSTKNKRVTKKQRSQQAAEESEKSKDKGKAKADK